MAAIATDRSLWTWGGNASGQLGNGNNSNTNTPGQIATGTTWTTVAAGLDFAVAISSAGTLYTWGDNISGQLGNSNNTSTNTPGQIAIGTSNWASVAAGTAFAVALQSNNTLWTWGANSAGQLGNGNNTGTNSPAQIASGNIWTQVAAGIGLRRCPQVGRHAVGLGEQYCRSIGQQHDYRPQQRPRPGTGRAGRLDGSRGRIGFCPRHSTGRHHVGMGR